MNKYAPYLIRDFPNNMSTDTIIEHGSKGGISDGNHGGISDGHKVIEPTGTGPVKL